VTKSAATKTEEAADELLDWLRRQPAVSRHAALQPKAFADGRDGTTADIEQVSADASEAGFEPTTPALEIWADRPGGRKVDHATPLRLANTDWLHHRLNVSGPEADVAQFRKAAAGAGDIPWYFDLDQMEEGFFHLLVAPEKRSVTVAGARIFARKLRERVGRRHDIAVARVGQSAACPLDLYALVPVPPEILALGPDEPGARAWLWKNWGTTESLRHVELEESLAWEAGDNAGEKTSCLRISFWSADWTPWVALKTIQGCYPTLSFDCRPSYDPA
jgi:hypothetical protein